MWTLTFWKTLAAQVIAVTAASAAGLLTPVLMGEISVKDAGVTLLGVAGAVVLKGLAASQYSAVTGSGSVESPNFKS